MKIFVVRISLMKKKQRKDKLGKYNRTRKSQDKIGHVGTRYYKKLQDIGQQGEIGQNN